MGLNIFDYIKWNGDMNILAYRHPKANLGKYTKLQVTDAQEAVVVVNGESMQKFGPILTRFRFGLCKRSTA